MEEMRFGFIKLLTRNAIKTSMHDCRIAMHKDGDEISFSKKYAIQIAESPETGDSATTADPL